MKKLLILLPVLVLFSGCYSVYSGGISGKLVDAESTSTPKSGISGADVYAYTDSATRDTDFNNWKEGSVFEPTASYYGHTATGSDGTFSISKMVWKSYNPTFGKDADTSTLYLIFYHEDFGLTKGSSVVISDTVGDTVYAELTSIKKTTTINFTFKDVTTDSAASSSVYVKVTVPQTTSKNTAATAKIYDATITGTGAITVSYPRYQSDEDKAKKVETTPEVQISYFQNASEVTWKACYNQDNTDKDYSFCEDGFTLSKKIQNQSYDLTLYGKSTKLSFPSISGTYGDTTSSANDGKIIGLKMADSNNAYTIEVDQTTTTSQTLGTSSSEKHGTFSGLAEGCFWTDTSYKGKYSTVKVQFFVNGSAISGSEKEIRSNDSSPYNVTL